MARQNGVLAGGRPGGLGDDFSWGTFFTNIGASAAQAAAQAGVGRAVSAIQGGGSGGAVPQQQQLVSASPGSSIDPTLLYVGGGFLALLVLVIAMKR